MYKSISGTSTNLFQKHKDKRLGMKTLYFTFSDKIGFILNVDNETQGCFSVYILNV